MEAFAGIEGGVRQSIARIQASPFVPRKDRVRGLVYDCATGRLREAPAAWSGASGRHIAGGYQTASLCSHLHTHKGASAQGQERGQIG